MTKLSNRLLGFLRRRTFMEKIVLVLVIQQVVYEALDRLAGVALPLDGLLTLVFFTLAFFVGIKYLFRLFRRTVWRLRNRLILAYVFIGVVPITLILVMLGLGMYILIGQVATYLMTAELNRRNEVVRDCAYALAWHVADLGDVRVALPIAAILVTLGFMLALVVMLMLVTVLLYQVIDGVQREAFKRRREIRRHQWREWRERQEQMASDAPTTQPTAEAEGDPAPTPNVPRVPGAAGGG